MTPDKIAMLRRKGVSGLMTPEELAELLAEVESAARLRDAVSQYLMQIDTFGVANNGMVACARKAMREAIAPIPS